MIASIYADAHVSYRCLYRCLYFVETCADISLHVSVDMSLHTLICMPICLLKCLYLGCTTGHKEVHFTGGVARKVVFLHVLESVFRAVQIQLAKHHRTLVFI